MPRPSSHNTQTYLDINVPNEIKDYVKMFVGDKPIYLLDANDVAQGAKPRNLTKWVQLMFVIQTAQVQDATKRLEEAYAKINELESKEKSDAKSDAQPDALPDAIPDTQPDPKPKAKPNSKTQPEQEKCSLSLHTKVKDKRDLICNLSHFYDKKNVKFTKEDEKKKCEIFDISNSKIDFITGQKVQTGDHYYPLGGLREKENKIGSDSEWNCIPVSGSNKKENIYNKLKKEILKDKNLDISAFESDEQSILCKLKKWVDYVEYKEAKMYHEISDEFNNKLKERDTFFVIENNRYYDTLKQMPPLN